MATHQLNWKLLAMEGLNGQQMEVAGVEGCKVGVPTWWVLWPLRCVISAWASDAGKVVLYLRSLRCVEKLAETRRCKPEPGRMARRRVFIKVLAIHPELAKALSPVQDEACLGQRSACSSLMSKRWVYLWSWWCSEGWVVPVSSSIRGYLFLSRRSRPSPPFLID